MLSLDYLNCTQQIQGNSFTERPSVSNKRFSSDEPVLPIFCWPSSRTNEPSETQKSLSLEINKDVIDQIMYRFSYDEYDLYRHAKANQGFTEQLNTLENISYIPENKKDSINNDFIYNNDFCANFPGKNSTSTHQTILQAENTMNVNGQGYYLKKDIVGPSIEDREYWECILQGDYKKLYSENEFLTRSIQNTDSFLDKSEKVPDLDYEPFFIQNFARNVNFMSIANNRSNSDFSTCERSKSKIVNHDLIADVKPIYGFNQEITTSFYNPNLNKTLCIEKETRTKRLDSISSGQNSSELDKIVFEELTPEKVQAILENINEIDESELLEIERMLREQ
ncbi:hypothetical protein BB560_006716 [Smittium megazygosporum]|uniref:Uncharacterized protein n=1 Tax=Smittium megazygosporum TaxID=133381 RepID=A0A2T9Y281_9FUNG|nr:hypothetical protein BB560_006716 [Smittium megazygosporum]